MRRLNHMLLAGITAIACSSCGGTKVEADYHVIPLPQEVSLTEAEPFYLTRSTSIAYPEGNDLLKRNAEFLAEYVKESAGFDLSAQAYKEGAEPAGQAIVLKLNPAIGNPEGYTIDISAGQVSVEGQTENGVFYGIQTLRKSIPATTDAWNVVLPAGHIADAPRFAYRGMLLDVCRHFFPVEFVKEYIDLLALHNMNTFHWHLTDDQGWRIEIDKYPKLTEVGSQRKCTVIGRNTQEYDSTPYGGFYTKEQAKEIVEYAKQRYITVIPEVDLPGHMLAALAAYPELGCTGGPYEVSPRWGIFEDVLCVGNEQTMQFLEDVMAEIIEIFPSEYVHIGGDESPRDRWEVCPKCQARIKSEGLKADANHSAEDRLQSYCMTRIEKFLNERGRKIIGWDEILDGDVAPNATVMSWRGMEGGIKAAKLGHDVIMVPTSYAYFDYYQTADVDNEPLGIGGYVPVGKVYSLEPVPTELTPEEQKHILGAQANLWTEYIATTEHVEYMVLPRMAALSEVQWTLPDKKDYEDFTQRLPRLMAFYERDGLNYAKHILDIKATFKADPATGKITAQLGTIDNAPIYYTLDGTEPNEQSQKYAEPGVAIDKTSQLRAVAIRPEGRSHMLAKDFFLNKATLRPIQLTGRQPSSKYAFDGAPTLVDGMRGRNSYANGEWLGFVGGDVEAIIEIEPAEISKVSTNAIVDMSAWIMGSTGLKVAVSEDGKTYTEVASKDYPAETDIAKSGIETYEVSFNPVKAHYVKVTVKRTPVLPKGHDGEGTAPYLFIDEISID